MKTFVLQDGSANPSDHHLVEWVIALPGYNRFSVVRLDPAPDQGEGRVVAMSNQRPAGRSIGTDTLVRRFLVMYGTVPIIEQAAREIRERHGSEVVSILRELAKNAAELADEIAAKEWRDIADATERVLREAARLSENFTP